MDADNALDTSDSRSDSICLSQSVRSAPDNSLSAHSSFSETSNGRFTPSQESTTDRSFRKVQSLNRAFEILPSRNGRRISRCHGCSGLMNTGEVDRLVTHIRGCSKTSLDMKENVLADYQKSLINNNDIRGKLLTRMLAAGNIGLRVVDLKAFLRFMRNIDKGYKPPSRRQISERFIPLLSHEIEHAFVKQIKRETTPLLSIEFDHWSDANRKSLLGAVATNTSGQRFAIDFAEENTHTAFAIVEKLKHMLNKIPSQAINAFISDSASSCIKTRQILTGLKEYEHVIGHRCIAHLLNRVGGYLSDSRYSPAIACPLSWAREVATIAVRSLEVRRNLREKGINQVKQATPTRWYSTANMLNSLLSAKEVILEHASSLQDCHKEQMILDESNWVNIERLKQVFDPLVQCIAVAEKKDSSLGEAVKSILEFGRSLFAADWNDPIILAAVKSYLSYFGPAKLKDEFGLLLAAYLLDRRYKLDYLTEDGIKLAFVAIVEVSSKSGLDIRTANRKLLPELHGYCRFEDDYANEPGEEKAIEWWKNRHDSGRLQQVALRFACLRSSSANIERTFSAMKYVQGLWRMSLSIETMRDLVRIRIDETGESADVDDSQEDENFTVVADNTYIADDYEATAFTVTGTLDDDMPTVSDDVEQQSINEDADDRMHLLDMSTRTLYLNFVRLIDFARITTVRTRSLPQVNAPSARQLVDEFCADRIALRDRNVPNVCSAHENGATCISGEQSNTIDTVHL